MKRLVVSCALSVLLPVAATAQAPPSYGPAITLDQAQHVMAGAEAKARENDWNVVIAIVDAGGRLVLLQRLDDTQYGSVDVALGKAETAVAFRRPSKAFEDVLAGGGAGLRILGLDGAVPLDGGLPIIVDGRVIGGIGVSGVTGEQDAEIALAGVDALGTD